MRALEREITELSAHLQAATYRLLCLIREFDCREGWGAWGVRSCAHWLNWRCGIALGAAREKVRVAHALAALPQISAAFRQGEVSYSKVRAMTRVATPENEDYLLMLAHHGTASHVERVVRGCRQVQAVEALEGVNERFAARHLTWYYDDDGTFVIRGRLPPEDGARVQKALEAALDEADRRWRAEVRERRQAADERAGRVSAETSREPAGHVSAETRCGTRAPDTRGEARGEAFPDREPAAARRADALVSMAETLLEHGPASGSGGDRYQIVVHAEAAGPAAIENGPALPGETVRRLACDASVVRMLVDGKGEPLDVGRKTRTIPAAIRRALKMRDRGCRFPGCTALHCLDAHHVTHWAEGGETRLSNLVRLCRFHHRLLHEGGFDMKVLDDGALVFTRPDGQRVHPAPHAPPARDPPSVEALIRRNREHGLAIDATTGECLWQGERMDLSMAVEGVLDGERHLRALRVDSPIADRGRS